VALWVELIKIRLVANDFPKIGSEIKSLTNWIMEKENGEQVLNTLRNIYYFLKQQRENGR
jgi:hypothetical protein